MKKIISELCYILGSDLPVVMTEVLKQELPKLDRDWWHKKVLCQLLGEQRSNFERRGFDNIEQMDLTLLVQVFERNWVDIKLLCSIDREERSYLNEIKAIRDKFAHTPLHLIPQQDVIRAYDTIKRFVNSIKPASPLVSNIEDILKSISESSQTNSVQDQNEPVSSVYSKVKGRNMRQYMCPIPGCDKIFNGSRGGWDGHAGSVRMHPDWHPDEEDHTKRVELFRLEFSDWFKND